MDPKRWDQIDALFSDLVELTEAERDARLASVDAVDTELRRHVEALIAADREVEQRLSPLEAWSHAPEDGASVTTEFVPDPFQLAGHTVSHFRVLEPLGAGGMGVVYRGEDVQLRREVALKFLLPQYSLDPVAKERFQREARSAAALDHPNICTIHEVGESEDGRLFLAMTRYAGETLKQCLAREGALPIAQAREIACQIARALAAAHDAGIVHRDLKAGNLMLTPDGTVKILDFGLAKVRDLSLTASGTHIGTVAYMAPEQLGGKPSDARADLWALGAVLYEMLTGRRPFEAEHDVSIAQAILHDEPAPVAVFRGDIPSELERVVGILLRKEPAERYATAQELLESLDDTLPTRRSTHAATTTVAVDERRAKDDAREPGDGQTSAGGEAGRRPTRRRIRQAGLALLVVTLLVLGARAAFVALAGTHGTYVLVLPFENLGPIEHDYFTDGVTEEIMATLAAVPGLRIISWTTADRYRHQEKTLRQIGRELNVEFVVEGSVRRQQTPDGVDRVRVISKLVRVADDSPIWAEDFDERLSDIFDVQARIARGVSERLVRTFDGTGEARAEVTPDQQAYDLVLKARYIRKRGRLAEQARDLFRQAVDLDPDYAAAWAGLASSYVVLSRRAAPHRVATLDSAEAAAHEALRLDSSSAESYFARGDVLAEKGAWVEAERSIQRAIQLDPSMSAARIRYAWLLSAFGCVREARREVDDALRFDPLSPIVGLTAVAQLWADGEIEAVIREARRLLETEPEYSRLYYDIGEAYYHLGQTDAAIHAFEQWLDERRPWHADPSFDLPASYYLARGDRDGLRELLAARKASHVDPGRPSDLIVIARAHAQLEEPDSAFTWLDRISTWAPGTVAWLQHAYWFDSLRSDPRYAALLERIGVVAPVQVSTSRLACPSGSAITT